MPPKTYNINAANLSEATTMTLTGQRIQQPIYDHSEFEAGTTTVSFFSRGIGDPLPVSGTAKTKFHTNLGQGGSLPAQNYFEMHSVQLGIKNVFGSANDTPEGILTDLIPSYMEIVIGDKPYLTLPSMFLTAGGGFDVFSAYDAATAAGTIFNYGQTGTDDPRAIWSMSTEPLILSPNQNFQVTLHFDIAPATVQDTQILTCLLGGFLYRPVQ